MSILRTFFFLTFYFLSVSSWSPSNQRHRSVVQVLPTNKLLSPSSSLFAAAENIENYETMLKVSDSTNECFKSKSVLITGASGGLGQSLALQLAECGVATIILSGRNQDALDKVAKECQHISPSIHTHIISCDLADRESVVKLGEQALKICPTIDVLINNGGVSSRSNFLDTKLEVDERVMQINFFAGVALAKALIPKMVAQQSGKVIWISSVQGLVGIPSRTSYAASKFAVQGYCEALRAEVATSGVTVDVASPGYIRTNLSLSAVTGDGGTHGQIDEATAKGAEPKSVAITILDSVANQKADFIVAGGFSATAAIWLRLLCPGVLRSMLVKRFVKSLAKPKND